MWQERGEEFSSKIELANLKLLIGFSTDARGYRVLKFFTKTFTANKQVLTFFLPVPIFYL
jgi:hypothetical protein